jgi:Uma2 family endonuclease
MSPMATQTRATGSGLVLYRLTVRQFEKMIDAGVFPEGAHVELIRGMLVDKMTKNDPHDYAVGFLGDCLRGILPAGWFVREEKSLKLGIWSRPEPDLIVVRGQHGDYRARTPQAPDIGLLIEVADSSYPKDHIAKLRLYAAWGIPAYWIVNIPGRRVEVYGNPTGRGKAACYRDAQTFGADADVPVVIDGQEIGRVAVRDLLP